MCVIHPVEEYWGILDSLCLLRGQFYRAIDSYRCHQPAVNLQILIIRGAVGKYFGCLRPSAEKGMVCFELLAVLEPNASAGSLVERYRGDRGCSIFDAFVQACLNEGLEVGGGVSLASSRVVEVLSHTCPICVSEQGETSPCLVRRRHLGVEFLSNGFVVFVCSATHSPVLRKQYPTLMIVRLEDRVRPPQFQSFQSQLHIEDVIITSADDFVQAVIRG
jgi:hypothetical protein